MSKEIKASGSSLCVKRNDLINTITKFSLYEYRLFNYIAAAIRHEVTQDFIDLKKDYITKIKIADIISIFKTVAEALQIKLVKIPTNRKSIVTVGIFKKQEYFIETGEIYIEIDVDLLPYIANLDAQFVQISLNQAREFSSINAWRLFELLKQWEKVGSKTFEIDELKLKIGVDGKYQKISNFEQHLLNPCIEQINDKTPLKVSYKKIKTGRRISSIKFFIGKTLYKKEIRKEINEIKNQKEEQQKQKNKTVERTKIWNAMSKQEQQENYPGINGYVQFMAEFSTK